MLTKQIVVTDNQQAGRYEGHVDGELVGFCDYIREGSRLIFPHTETLPEYRGRGVADTIVAYALADAERQNLTVVPQCWFVDQYLRTKKESTNRRGPLLRPRAIARTRESD